MGIIGWYLRGSELFGSGTSLEMKWQLERNEIILKILTVIDKE